MSEREAEVDALSEREAMSGAALCAEERTQVPDR